MATQQSVAFHTLGCKLNFSETSTISRKFEGAGYTVVPFRSASDIYVINTCSVTDFADRKCRKAVRDALKKNEEAKIVVIGCYAQLKPQEISEIPGVDLVLGAAEKFNVLQYIDQLSMSPDKGIVHNSEINTVHSFEESFSFGDRTRSFLKVQDGCDYSCTFCTIPLARGKSRSNTIEKVVDQANEIAKLGTQEIVLTGVNIGDFKDGPHRFIDLIRALDQVEGIKRFRISSIEPNLCSDEIISFVAQSERFVPHFHMPLQSGSNEILGRMRRRYKRELFENRVRTIKDIMPHCCIGVDVIVGFPGETDAHFQETFEFIHALDISYLHVFTYSERVNTIADEMADPVPMQVRRQRNEQLRLLSDKKKHYFYTQHLGEVHRVILENSRTEGELTGFTENYIKVAVKQKEGLAVNQMLDAQLLSITNDTTLKVDAKPTLKHVPTHTTHETLH